MRFPRVLLLLVVAAIAALPGGADGRALATGTLTVQVLGDGKVKSEPGGPVIDCGQGATICYVEYESSTIVDLTAEATAGWTFEGWDSDFCDGTSRACQVPPVGTSGDRGLIAEFTKAATLTRTLTVTEPEGGSVISPEGEIDCEAGAVAGCTWAVIERSTITVLAEPETGRSFGGWTGGCSGVTRNCTLVLDVNRTVGATFPLQGSTRRLTVTVTGNGTVTGGGINCTSAGGSGCTANPTANSTVILTAVPPSGATLTWGGACIAATGLTCQVTMTADLTVTAAFSGGGGTETTFPLSVSVSGTGTVTGGAISCTSAGGSGCTANLTANSSVTLTATPGTGASFGGWGGACSGTATTCQVAMTAARSVTATFSSAGPAGFPLTVSVSGKGTVTGGGIACGNGGKTCSANPAAGSTVVLTAIPAAGAVFSSWGGACTGAKTTCSVLMNAAKSVTAAFRAAAARPPASKGPAGVLRSGGAPVVRRVTPGFQVTLRFITTRAGTARIRALRAGQVVTTVSLGLAPGLARVGPFPVPLPGFYTFEVVLAAAAPAKALKWRACLGACGAAAPASAGPFVLTGAPPTITPAGSAWRVILHFSTNRPAAVNARALRGTSSVRKFELAAHAGRNSTAPFVLAPGNYTLAVSAVNAFGRVRTVSWFAVLPR